MEGKRAEDDTSVMRTKEGKESESKSEGKVHEKSCSKRAEMVKKKKREATKILNREKRKQGKYARNQSNGMQTEM